MSTGRTVLTVVVVFVTILGMTAVLGGATGATISDTSEQAGPDTAAENGNDDANDDDDDEEEDDGHDHSDEPPENNENPDDPPCDADHGHPANNSEQCDDDGAGNGTDGDNNGNDGNETDNGNNGNNGNETDNGNNGNNGNETDNGNNGNNGNETDNGNNGEGALGTCEQGGAFQNNTVANEAFGTENEEGPISSGLHENEEQFQELEPVVHEGSCVVATVDNNA